MLNVIIELNKEDKTFDVKWVMEKEGILEVGKNYCPCCYYRLNSNKNKVIELMDALFKEEATTIPKSEKVIKKMLEEYYASLQEGVLDFNIVVSKEIIDNRIPLKGIILKEKHVIVEEVSDKNLGEKDKKILDEIRDGFSGKSNKKFLDNASKIMSMLDNGAKMTREDLWNEDGSPKTVEEVIANVKKRNDIKEDEEVKSPQQESVKNETKEDLNSVDPIENVKKMFEIMTTKVKLTREDLFNEDGSRKPVDEVYEIVQSKKDIENKTKEFVKDNKIDVEKLLKEMFGQPLSEKSRRGNYSRGVEIEKGGLADYMPWRPDLDKNPVKEDVKSNVKTVDDELDKLIKFIKTPNSAFEKFKAVNELLTTLNTLEKGNTDVDELLEEVFGKSSKLDKNEMLKKIMDHCRKMFDGTEAIGKPIKDVEDGGCTKLNQVATTLEKIRKTATYDMSKNGKPMYSITLNKSIFLFNNIDIYYLDHIGRYRKYYIHVDVNGIPSSNESIEKLEAFLLNYTFSNVIDFNQQRYLANTEFKMPGMIYQEPDLVLLMNNITPRNFPNPEKLIKDVKVTNFYNLVNPVVFTKFTFKRAMENRTATLTEETPYDSPFTERASESFRRENLNSHSFSPIIHPSYYRPIIYVDFRDDNIFFSRHKVENVSGYYVVNPITSNTNRELNDFLTRHLDGRLDNIFFMTLAATLHFSKEYNNPELVFELVKDDKPTEDKTNEPVDSNTKKDNEDNEILYLSVYQNKLRTSIGSTLNQQSKKILYKISDNNVASNIKELSTWINAMHQGIDKKYFYKDILITASALKKLRQEETFGEMNFEEVGEVK